MTRANALADLQNAVLNYLLYMNIEVKSKNIKIHNITRKSHILYHNYIK